VSSAINQLLEMPRDTIINCIVKEMCPYQFGLNGNHSDAPWDCDPYSDCLKCWVEPIKSNDVTPEDSSIEYLTNPLLEYLPTLTRLYEVCLSRNQHEKAESVWASIGSLINPQIKMTGAFKPNNIIDGKEEKHD